MLVDLHVHLRGTLVREAVLALADRNAISIPSAVLSQARYGWYDFASFLKAYDLITSVVRSAADLEFVTSSYLQRCAAVGGGYVEFMLSPPDLARTGVPFPEQLKALEAAADRAAEEWVFTPASSPPPSAILGQRRPSRQPTWLPRSAPT